LVHGGHFGGGRQNTVQYADMELRDRLAPSTRRPRDTVRSPQRRQKRRPTSSSEKPLE